MEPLTDDQISAIAAGEFSVYGEELNLRNNDGGIYGHYVCLTGEALQQLAQRYLDTIEAARINNYGRDR
jgi:hypothetical protein